MAVEITPTSKKFFTQYRNGDDFTENPTQTTEFLQCNRGDLVRFEETISISVSSNETGGVILDYVDMGAGVGQFSAFGINFKDDGLEAGQSIDIIYDGVAYSSTVLSISGASYNVLRFNNTLVTPFITDFAYKNVTIRVKSAPDYLRYQYGVLRSTALTNDYSSPLDGSTQAYTLDGITTTFADMTRVGATESWDLSTVIQVRQGTSIDAYTHVFEIRHVFRPHWFIASELGNLIPTISNPIDLFGVNTVKYVNGFFFGYASTAIVAEAEDNFGTVGSGNVGWYNEALNGNPNIYTVDSVTFSSDSDVLEISETNTVTAVITASSGVFTSDQKVIAHHTRLSTVAQYAGQYVPIDEVFFRDSQSQTAGSAAVGSGIITNMTVVQDSTTQITVTFNVSFTTAQQEDLLAGEFYLLYLTVGSESLTQITEQPVNLVLSATRYTKDPNQTGYLTNAQPSYYDSNAAYTGPRIFTNVSGYNMDTIGVTQNFRLTQFNDGSRLKMTSIKSRVIAVNSTTGDEFELFSKLLPTSPNTTIESGGYKYQALNLIQSETTRLPSDEPLNSKEVVSTPSFPAGFQPVMLKSFFRVPWRDWIENLAVNPVFFNALQPNNNLNEKTSNYSGVSGYQIFHEFMIQVTRFETISLPGGLTGEGIINVSDYRLRSDHFNILDFDVDDGSGGSFTASWSFQDIDGNAAGGIYSDSDTMAICELTHALGTLNVSDLWAEMRIEANGTSTEPWALHSAKDWTNDENPLYPSNQVDTDNTQFVEIESELNKVTIRCMINSDNLIDGVQYNIYSRLGKKT